MQPATAAGEWQRKRERDTEQHRQTVVIEQYLLADVRNIMKVRWIDGWKDGWMKDTEWWFTKHNSKAN